MKSTKKKKTPHEHLIVRPKTKQAQELMGELAELIDKVANCEHFMFSCVGNIDGEPVCMIRGTKDFYKIMSKK